MHIASLSLRDFRSWAELEIDLTPGVTVFVGRNGQGKTNIVEAVGYLAHLSSHRVATDAPLVRDGQENARVSAVVHHEGRELAAHLLIKPKGSNLAQLNRTKLDSSRRLLGVVRTVLFAPEDLRLIRGEPVERRNFLDEIISTRMPRLAGVKADYEKIVRQRNALLKQVNPASIRSGADENALSTLDVWDSQLAHLGAQIVVARRHLTAEIDTHIHQAYATLAPESRPAHVSYFSTVDEALADLVGPLPSDEPLSKEQELSLVEAALLAALGASRNKELERGMTLVGPHRDDLLVSLGTQPAKGYASHGETWSMALAMRLATATLFRADGVDPIVILDDVFAELDAKRRERLVMQCVDSEQVLITAAVGDDLPANLSDHVVARHVVSTTLAADGKSTVSVLNATAEDSSEQQQNSQESSDSEDSADSGDDDSAAAEGHEDGES